MKISSNVPVGLGTILGLVTTVCAGLIAIVQSVEQGAPLLTGANKPAAIAAFAAPILTALGRMYQAAHLPGGAAVAGVTADVPAELQALAAEAQANVAKLRLAPDGVDGPHVAFATEAQAAAEAQAQPQPPPVA